jgi:hypothetical protein
MTTRSLATGAVLSGVLLAGSSFALVLLSFLGPEEEMGPMLPALIVLCVAAATAMMVLLGLYMYKDARSRGMSGGLAVLLLVLIGPPGLVIYLLLRKPLLAGRGTA